MKKAILLFLMGVFSPAEVMQCSSHGIFKLVQGKMSSEHVYHEVKRNFSSSATTHKSPTCAVKKTV